MYNTDANPPYASLWPILYYARGVFCRVVVVVVAVVVVVVGLFEFFLGVWIWAEIGDCVCVYVCLSVCVQKGGGVEGG